MIRSKLLAAAIFASACVNTLEGPPLDELEGTGGSAGAASGASNTGAMGGTTPQGGNVGGGTSGALSGSSAIGGTGSSGTGVAGTGLGGTSVGGTSGAALGGSSGTGFGGASGTIATGGSTTGSTFPAVRDLIVEVCADTACHGSRERPLLTATNLYTTLTTTSVRQCGNDRLVTPGDTANSAILGVLNGQCGNLLMPESCMEAPCLGPAEQMIISSWIAAGAPQ